MIITIDEAKLASMIDERINNTLKAFFADKQEFLEAMEDYHLGQIMDSKKTKEQSNYDDLMSMIDEKISK